MTDPILVTGGTGTLGRVVVQRLLAGGHDVSVLSRARQPEAKRPPQTWHTGDLRTGTGVDEAVAGVSTIVHCATTNGRADVDAARHLIESAQRATGPHLVYISIVGIDVVPLRYYRAKLEVEQLLADSGLPYTVLRATQFHDLIARIVAAQRWSPVTVVPSRIRFQPIDVRDVADRLVELAVAPAAGRVPDIGGPEVRGITDLAHAYLRASGHRRVVLPVPVGGKVIRAYRAGGHLCPDRAVGEITFEEFLSDSIRPG